MKLALMIEGQEDVTWQDWKRLAELAETHGYQALMRSDHYLSVGGRTERGALDAWGTICALATMTERVRLGTLVSPVTFRPAAVLAKLALTADHVSGGRIDVGMGTGWNEGEHEAFGLELPPMKERFAQLEQQVADVTRFWDEFEPKPVQPPCPRLVLGGQAKPRAARLAAQYADEYNLLYSGPDVVREKRALLDDRLELSMMLGFAVGETQADVDRRLDELEQTTGTRGNETWLIGTPDTVIAQIKELADAGLDRIMLQHLLHRDDDAVALIAQTILPQVA